MTLDNVNLNLVSTFEEACEFKRWLSEVDKRGMIAFDTEGTGLSPEQDRVRLAQFGDDHTGWAIPFDDWRGFVREIVNMWEGQFIMHNASYDCAMVVKDDIIFPRYKVHDTRLMGHVIEPTQSTALKNQAARHIDPKAALMQQQLDDVMKDWTWATIPIIADTNNPLSVYWIYGALDPVLTFQLFNVHYPVVTEQAPRAYELELGTSWVTNDMSRRGTRIDHDYTKENQDRFREFIDNAEQWCIDTYSVKPGSRQKIIKILQDEGYGDQLNKRTESGALSLDKEVLASIDHPLTKTVLKRRQAEKLQSTFLRRFIEYSAFDGYLHPNINSIGGSNKSTGTSEGISGVRTGRMSMDSPNLQQLPRKSESNAMASVIRNCVIPRDGNILLMSDFDQIEMRVLAHLADDHGMRNAFGGDVDFFTTLARELYNDPQLIKSDPRRQTTKNGGYAIAYGAGLARFAWTAGITVDEAQVFLKELHSKYPGVKRLQQETERNAFRNQLETGDAFVRSPLTGRRHVADQGKIYALVNYLIQGTSAEIFKQKLLELDSAGLGEFMILPVHDEIIFDVPVDQKDDVIETIRSVMNDNNICSVPITAGVAEGERWGEKIELD